MKKFLKVIGIVIGSVFSLFVIIGILTTVFEGSPGEQPGDTAAYEKQMFGEAVEPTATDIFEAEEQRLEREVQAGKRAPLAERKALVSRIRYEYIRTTMLTATSARFDSYRRSIIGKRVAWAGYVSNVSKRTLGGFEAYIDMDRLDDFSVSDVNFIVSLVGAEKLRKGSAVRFEGDIESVNNILGSCMITLRNVEIKI